MAARHSEQGRDPAPVQPDDEVDPVSNDSRSIDRDSAGVYFMSIEDFERRIVPDDAGEKGEGGEG